jgi:hypothetical protein
MAASLRSISRIGGAVRFVRLASGVAPSVKHTASQAQVALEPEASFDSLLTWKSNRKNRELEGAARNCTCERLGLFLLSCADWIPPVNVETLSDEEWIAQGYPERIASMAGYDNVFKDVFDNKVALTLFNSIHYTLTYSLYLSLSLSLGNLFRHIHLLCVCMCL